MPEALICSVCGQTVLQPVLAEGIEGKKVMLHFCANCDRVRCGKCRKPVLDGKQKTCCGQPVGVYADLRKGPGKS